MVCSSDIASSLDSMDLLLPGDVILLLGSHVMIFINFVNDKKTCVQIVDVSRSTGKVFLRTVILLDLIKRGYRGYGKENYSNENICTSNYSRE